MRRRALLRAKVEHDTGNESARAGDAHHDSPQTGSRTADGAAESGASQCTRRAAWRGGQATGVMETDLQRLAAACNKAAEHYCENPGAAGPETVVDIYRAMAALAAMMDTQIKTYSQSNRLH